ncbi:ankyrin repeat-containing domain protein [Immersiella caudata]|uniref:Ankyrin repeat-containing domain protein n=1 Tax=Immersiella caudata TaxID=314043 RepID=A0AA39XHC6_9PEZI|nr:ankyrin repeat-containing domain protein [Immersiella caudata]
MDLNKDDEMFGRAVSAAALGGHADIVRLLSRKGAELGFRRNYDPTDQFQDITSLEIAALGGNVESVALILDQTKEGIQDALQKSLTIAAEMDNLDVTRLLLSQHHLGAGCSDTLIIAINRGHQEVAKLLVGHPEIDPNVKDSKLRRALLLASRRSWTGVERILLSRDGIDPHPRNPAGHETPIAAAAQHGNEELVHHFVEEGPAISYCFLSVFFRPGLWTNMSILKLLWANCSAAERYQPPHRKMTRDECLGFLQGFMKHAVAFHKSRPDITAATFLLTNHEIPDYTWELPMNEP